MKKLRIIGNIIFFSLVVYFIGQSVNVFLGKKANVEGIWSSFEKCLFMSFSPDFTLSRGRAIFLWVNSQEEIRIHLSILQFIP